MAVGRHVIQENMDLGFVCTAYSKAEDQPADILCKGQMAANTHVELILIPDLYSFRTHLHHVFLILNVDL